MRRYLVPALLAGIVGIVLAPVIGPTVGRLLRPVAKGSIKAGVSLYRRGSVVAAELLETAEDLTAEATHELDDMKT